MKGHKRTVNVRTSANAPCFLQYEQQNIKLGLSSLVTDATNSLSRYAYLYLYSCRFLPVNRNQFLINSTATNEKGEFGRGLKNKYQLDATYYFTVLLTGSTCFGHYYAHHQELATIMLITTLVVSFLVCCRLEVRLE